MDLQITAAGLSTGASVLFVLIAVKELTRHPAGRSLDRFRPLTGRDLVMTAADPGPDPRPGPFRSLSRLAGQAGVELSGRQIALLVLVAGTAVGGTVFTITGTPLVAAVSALAGFAAPRFWLGWQQAGRLKLLTAQIEQAVAEMAAVVRAGSGLPPALERAARSAHEPLRTELTRITAELQVGYSAGEAFSRAAERLGVKEMQLIALAVSLQQAGMAVNLALVFDQVQDTIRARRAFREQVSALTAEGRLAAWVVGAMPFFVLGLFRWMAPEFVAPLFATVWGWSLLAVTALVIMVGIVWILRLAQGEPAG